MAEDRIKVSIDAETSQAQAAINKLGKSVENTDSKAKGLSMSFGGMFAAVSAGNIAANALTRVIGEVSARLEKATNDARDFAQAIAEINTLLPKNQALTQSQINTLAELGIQYATGEVQQAKTYYQIVSAGITDAARAMDVLSAANALAQGGLGNVETAVLGLTKVINNYGDGAGSAADISDILFTAVKNGQTSIDEFADALPKVLAISEQLGISFADTAAALTTLTNRSENTAIASTELNALFSSLIKSQDKLSKITDANGEKFDLQSLKAKGLTKFLSDLGDATGGVSGLQAALGGSIQSLNVVLKFSADNYEALTKNTKEFTEATGAAQRAAEEIQGTIKFKEKQASVAVDTFLSTLAGKFDTFAGKWYDTVASVANFLNEVVAEKAFKTIAEEVAFITQEIERLNAAAKNPFSSDYRNAARDIAELKNRLSELKVAQESEAKTAQETAEKAKAAAELKLKLEQERAAAERKIKAETNEALKTLDDQQAIETQEGLQAAIDREREIQEQRKNEDFERKIQELEAEGNHQQALENIASESSARKIAIYQKELDAKKKKQAEELAQQQAFFSTAITLANSQNKTLAAIGKAAALADLAIKTPKAVADSFAFGARVGGPPLGFALGAVAAAAMAAQSAQIVGLKGFADGGVIGGMQGATAGSDNRMATVRDGEMVLNAGQQETLFNAIQSGSLGGGNTQVVIQVNDQRFADAFEAQIVQRRKLGTSRI